MLTIDPPILNSACPWATTLEDLTALYLSEAGAVTTRTATLTGFAHNDSVHQHGFFSPDGRFQKSDDVKDEAQSSCDTISGVPRNAMSSLNTYGYSPIPLQKYCEMIEQIYQTHSAAKRKPFIISVTGTAEEVGRCYRLIGSQSFAKTHEIGVEVNLSCPNIADKPPPAYSGETLREYLVELGRAWRSVNDHWAQGVRLEDRPQLPQIGLKLPPYTYATQFREIVDAIASQGNMISFITTTNTLGSCAILQDRSTDAGTTRYGPALASESGSGIGGMAGAAIHPLSLGNVATLKRLLLANPATQHIQIIGVGGVSDRAGVERMEAAGADYVACATVLGLEGPAVFAKLLCNA